VGQLGELGRSGSWAARGVEGLGELRRREHSFGNQVLSTDGSTVAIGSNRVFPLSRLERVVRRPCLLASLMAAWLACSPGGWRPNPEPSPQPQRQL
jgi:hypothetical protein